MQRHALTAACLVLALPALAQEAASDAVVIPEGVSEIEEISLTDLLEAEVEVAALTPQTIREAAGVLTVVTREEILAAGARTLLDVLLLVPGFVPNADVEGAYSVVFRGINSTDGRQLFLIDGMIIDDFMYTFVTLGNRFPVDMIERVEIIRGPGSAIYGGSAQLTVVNIVTRGAEHHQGVAVSATAGMYEDVDARQTLSLRYADQFGKDVSTSLLLYAGRSHRSNKPYTDYYGETYDLSDGGELPLFVDFGARLKDFKLRFIYENYRNDVRDNYDASTPTPYRISYENVFLGIEHPIAINEHASVTPRLSAIRQKPWEVEDFTAMDAAGLSPYYRKAASRLTGSLTFNWDVTEKLNLLAGTEAYLEQGKILGSPDLIDYGFQTLQEGEMEVTHENVAAFAQGQHESIIGILTLGARLESHSAYGASFVPRAGLTRVFGPAHVKLLASRAFRAPGLENINAQSPSEPIGPEKTTVYELEAGVRLGKNAIVTGNVYDITVDDPIVYLFDETTGEEGYENFTTTGSLGFELEARLRFLPRVWVTTSYSWYSTAGKNEVEVYNVPTPEGVRVNSVLGIPRHKIAFLGSVQIVGSLRAQPQFVYLSKRAGYLTPYDMDFNLAATDADPVYLASFFLSYQDLGVKGLDVSAGVHNILDEDFPLIQPYLGYHPPVPWPGREYMLRVSWEQ